ncbi:MAG TPA: YebC/PmpR family DNA-binding transcriptional regulator [Candidatus Sumerlaeota bacterium]|nr:YebC/PmpR family DNA-binding transcriptional regulator [Candidatus Sumerlaeota bacterium]HOR26461.1 YebC/PmpR family DNA-binding transcriptional regulator [Candidatus Sumerlaeota bacterium]
MSGHSKWHSIRHKKAVVDAKRGAMFTRLIKEIAVAARMGGSDIDGNPRLRTAVTAARDANMPKENIERAIKKGAGELEGVSYEDFTLEGYGQAGVAILVEGTTDNKNRTIPEIRAIFNKGGGSLGAQGCVAWMFTKRGVILIPTQGQSEETVMEAALEAGAEDLENEGEYYRILTEPNQMEDVRAAIEAKGIKVESSSLRNIPSTTVKVEGEDAPKLLRLLEALEEHDDVTSVSANEEIDDAVLEQYAQ